ncbi:MAG: hypothetical protein Kow00124_17000 [Anaerolineae bacterium]
MLGASLAAVIAALILTNRPTPPGTAQPVFIAALAGLGLTLLGMMVGGVRADGMLARAWYWLGVSVTLALGLLLVLGSYAARTAPDAGSRAILLCLAVPFIATPLVTAGMLTARARREMGDP